MLSRSQRARLQALQRRRGREESGEFLVEGVRLVEELLASPLVPHLALISPSLEDTSRGQALARRLRGGAEVLEVSDAALAQVCTTGTPQGVAAVARIPSYTLNDIAFTDASLAVVLDAVQDPGNFGTIARCADAFAAAAVIALPGTVDPWNPKSVRSAAGSSLRLPIVMASLDDLSRVVHGRGGTILGAAVDGDDVAAVASGVARPVALVLGNEGAGLAEATRAACDRLVSVPIRGAAESLNVAVAAGILMYALTRDS